MTKREKFIATLECKPITGRIPHFELEFFLTMEVFGRVHPSNRNYSNWFQMSETERTLHRKDVADLHIASAEHFEQNGFLYNTPSGWDDTDLQKSMEHVREISGMEYFTSLHGDATYAIPNGDNMMDFVEALYENPEKLKDDAQKNVDLALKKAEEIKKWGNSFTVILTSVDVSDLKIKEGDMIDLEKVKIIRGNKNETN